MSVPSGSVPLVITTAVERSNFNCLSATYGNHTVKNN